MKDHREEEKQMPLDIDRYPSLGPKRRISGPEEALRLVRELYPAAGQYGSTGNERTWTVGEPHERVLVAHHWNPGWGRIWWIRIAPTLEEGIEDSW